MEDKKLTIVDHVLTAVEVRAQVNLIQEVMKSVMKDKVHYGTIPGCGDKPTLLKAGAEKIMMTFRLAADPTVEDLSTSDERRYRVTVKLRNFKGDLLGAGIGECSSSEEKYKWRKVICDEEFNETPEDRRREKWSKGYQGAKPFKTKQIRTSIADIANTILKMAKKRGQVDAVLTTTAASDIFTQDIEDMPQELVNPSGKKDPVKTEKKTDPTPYGKMMKKFADAKKDLGEDTYYNILGTHGWTHANEIKDVKTGDKVIADMAQTYRNRQNNDN